MGIIVDNNNSLQSWCEKNDRLDLLSEWDCEKNLNNTPNDVTAMTAKKVWWICKQGHEYLSSVNSRTGKRTGCPICANRRVLPGYNDLQTTHPDLAKEWHPIRNGTVKPTDIVAGSTRKVWWICQCGNEWQAQVGNRTNLGRGCPRCGTIKQQKNKNINHIKTNGSLSDSFPYIAKEWHKTNNGDLKPTDVTAGSNKRVW